MGLPMCEWMRMQIERHQNIQQWMDDYSIMWEDIETILNTQDIDAKIHAVLVFDETHRETRLWYRGTLRTPTRTTRSTPQRLQKKPATVVGNPGNLPPDQVNF